MGVLNEFSDKHELYDTRKVLQQPAAHVVRALVDLPYHGGDKFCCESALVELLVMQHHDLYA